MSGYWETAFREELLEKARTANKHGLLVCDGCGWSWLTMETATIDWSLGGYGVSCSDRSECVRRSGMRMRVFVPSARSKKGKFYEFSTGRRATPLCSYDTFTTNGVIRGEECYCHLPSKVN